MTTGIQRLLPLLRDICAGFDENLPLPVLAQRSGWSQSYFHRLFSRFLGESPKQYTQRVRLDRAAAELLATDASVLDVALDAGFRSHEVFTRAFRRQFGRSPRDYRMQSSVPPGQRYRYRQVVRAVSPCVRLYGLSLSEKEETRMPTSAIERRELESEQPILYIQRRIPVSQLQQTMGECFGALFGHGQKAGLPIAGHPISRYVSTGAGLWTVDLIMPLMQPAESSGEMKSGVLVSGPVAFAVHEGPYDQLSETYAAIEQWIEANGYRPGGPPWESYVTDPGETPNPADWRTEVFWPLEAS